MRRLIFAFCLGTGLCSAQVGSTSVTVDRLVKAQDEPQNWLTYSGTYASQRYSTLSQITPLNAKTL